MPGFYGRVLVRGVGARRQFQIGGNGGDGGGFGFLALADEPAADFAADHGGGEGGGFFGQFGKTDEKSVVLGAGEAVFGPEPAAKHVFGGGQGAFAQCGPAGAEGGLDVIEADQADFAGDLEQLRQAGFFDHSEDAKLWRVGVIGGG